MVNIYGPGLTGDNAVAERPAQVPTGSGADLWFKECTSLEAQDGTRFRAQWFNFIMANFRNAVRGLSVPEDEIDDDMLLKCFQKLQNTVTAWLNLPIYPEILQSGNVLSITALSGSIRIDGGQSFIHRGWNKVLTNDYDDAARTTAHTANKTYHLRWQYNNGSPLFVLKDTADGVYNPTAAAETNAAFDSTYDDMLIAKVVTNGSNVATITQLANKAKLSAAGTPGSFSGGNATMQDGSTPTSITIGLTITLNWARTPRFALVGFTDIIIFSGQSDIDYVDTTTEIEMNLGISEKSRYTALGFYQRHTDPGSARLRWSAEA